MLSRCHVRRFRGFEDLQLSGLGRINLIVGRNNSGKTSVLEALALLSAGAMVRVSQGVLDSRPLSYVRSEKAIRDTVWRHLFWRMQTDRAIEIEGETDAGGISLQINLGNRSKTVVDLGEHAPWIRDGIASKSVLEFLCHRKDRQEFGAIQLGRDQMVFHEPNAANVPIPWAFVMTRSLDVENIAEALSDLKRTKRDGILLDSLRHLAPQLKNVETGTASGNPMIWCDLGLPEMLPLGVAGEGMLRVAQLVLAMQGLENGIVLYDEVESGLHHSVLVEAWQALEHASREFGTQIFATTHSIECLRAAHEALPADALRVYRLQGEVENEPVVDYDSESLGDALEFGFEMR